MGDFVDFANFLLYGFLEIFGIIIIASFTPDNGGASSFTALFISVVYGHKGIINDREYMDRTGSPGSSVPQPPISEGKTTNLTQRSERL